MSFLVREIRAEDREAVWALLRQFAVSYPPNEDAFLSSFEVVIAETVFLACESEEAVRGYLIAHVLPTLFANGPILEIVELIVDEGSRSLGMGRALVEAALSRAKELDCVEAVVPTRRAGPFYESLGFSRSAEYFKLKI